MSGRHLQVKAILLKEGVEDGMKEIRRFRVDEDSCGTGVRERFQNLQTRIHSVFKVDIATQQCTLSWKDEDGDFIQFSTGEELCHAVDNMNDDTLRIYATVTPRVQEDPMESNPEEDEANREPGMEPGPTFHPPLPPHPWQWAGQPHPGCGPPPFLGPFSHGGWKNFKKWKRMGPGGWKGGWKGGLRFGWPGAGIFGGPECGWKWKGAFKHGWGHKTKKLMKMKHRIMALGRPEEFHKVRQQVPAEFRGLVRQYVNTWYTQGPEAALTAARGKLPEKAGPDFPHWLHTFLSQYFSHPTTTTHTSGGQQEEANMEEMQEGEVVDAPEGLPPIYFQWLSLFVPRFFWRHGHMYYTTASDCEADEGPQYRKDHWCGYGQRFRHQKKRFGKQHGCQRKKGGKHGGCSSSSESEDSDSGKKAWSKVPKGFRKFARTSMKQLHKKKGDHPKIKAKAALAGLSVEVQEFVEQVLLEWHIKLSRHPPQVVSREMMEGERTLPSGLEQEHFQWLCRFLARWHCRHAGKCDVMSGWSSGNTTDDTSGDETTNLTEPGSASCPFYPHSSHFGSAEGAMHGYPHGMMGHPHHHFPMHPGMERSCPPPPPPPPPMFGGWFTPPPPPPAYTCGPCGEVSSDQGMDCQSQSGSKNHGPGVREGRSAETRTSQDDMVDHVTEGVKKM